LLRQALGYTHSIYGAAKGNIFRFIAILYTGAAPAHTIYKRKRKGASAVLGFVLGCMVGGTVGVVTMCCCTAGSETDRLLEQKQKQKP